MLFGLFGFLACGFVVRHLLGKTPGIEYEHHKHTHGNSRIGNIEHPKLNSGK